MMRHSSPIIAPNEEMRHIRDTDTAHSNAGGAKGTRTPDPLLAKRDTLSITDTTTHDAPRQDAQSNVCSATASDSKRQEISPSNSPARPIAPAPLIENIPAELKARRQWIVWRSVPKSKGKKPDKKPYTADADAPAGPCDYTNSDNWRSFDQAVAFYHSRSGYFAGIGYVFSEDDPYVGGDIDHCLGADAPNAAMLTLLPDTYAEISPSGDGVKFIARATGHYGTKKPLGELYSQGRYFTITGNVLPGHEQITDQQEAVERFYQAIGGGKTTYKCKSSGAGNGSRAQLAADIPESEWDAGRQLVISGAVDQVVNRVKAAAGEGTQLGVLLAADYAAFHARWPFVGIYRADGTLDTSQVRAVAARGIRGRGFTFAQYAAAMHRLYAAEALAKWGNKEAWRQELAALWFKSPEPRFQWQPRPAPKAKRTPRGRAGSHAALVEQVYQQLLDHRDGVTARQLAGVIYCARETVARIIAELVAAKRIETHRLPRHGGLAITILDVIYSTPAEADSAQADAPNEQPIAAALEETEYSNRVSSNAAGDHSSPLTQQHVDVPSLEALAAYYLDQSAQAIGQRYVQKGGGPLLDESTGEVMVDRPPKVLYRRTAKHFAVLVTAEYPYTAEQAIEAYTVERERRKVLAAEAWQHFFTRLRGMSDDELITYIGGRCRSEVAEMAREGLPFDKHLYTVRLKCAKQQLARRGVTMPSRKTRIEQAAQEAAAEARQARRRALQPAPKQPLVACQPIRYERPAEPTPAQPWRSSADLGLLAGLYDRKAALSAAGGD